jgi:hypothetical protein
LAEGNEKNVFLMDLKKYCRPQKLQSRESAVPFGAILSLKMGF